MVIGAVYSVIPWGKLNFGKRKVAITFDGEKDWDLWKDRVKESVKKWRQRKGLIEIKESKEVKLHLGWVKIVPISLKPRNKGWESIKVCSDRRDSSEIYL